MGKRDQGLLQPYVDRIGVLEAQLDELATQRDAARAEATLAQSQATSAVSKQKSLEAEIKRKDENFIETMRGHIEDFNKFYVKLHVYEEQVPKLKGEVEYLRSIIAHLVKMQGGMVTIHVDPRSGVMFHAFLDDTVEGALTILIEDRFLTPDELAIKKATEKILGLPGED